MGNESSCLKAELQLQLGFVSLCLQWTGLTAASHLHVQAPCVPHVSDGECDYTRLRAHYRGLEGPAGALWDFPLERVTV